MLAVQKLRNPCDFFNITSCIDCAFQSDTDTRETVGKALVVLVGGMLEETKTDAQRSVSKLGAERR